jgi:hypothetical protein
VEGDATPFRATILRRFAAADREVIGQK